MGNSHGTVTQTQSKCGQFKNVIPYNCTHNCSPSKKIQKGWGGGRMNFQKTKENSHVNSWQNKDNCLPLESELLRKQLCLVRYQEAISVPKITLKKWEYMKMH